RSEVDRLRERAKVKVRLERLGQSRTLLRYQAAKNVAKDAKERAKALNQELKHLKDTAAPTLAKLNSTKEYEAKAREFRNRHQTELNASCSACEERGKAIAKRDDERKDKVAQIQAER